MSYRIVYGPMPPAPREKNYKTLRLQTLTAVFLILFVLAVRQAWPEGAETLRRFFIPGEPTVTEAAFSDMLMEIKDGEPVGDAFTAFCAEILENGTQEAD